MSDPSDSPFRDDIENDPTADTGNQPSDDPADTDESEETPDESRRSQEREGLPKSGGGDDPDHISRLLANELRDDSVSAEDRQLLRAELADRNISFEEHIGSLQSRVSDFEAYTSALQEFIDENGQGQEILEELEDQAENLNDEQVNIQATVKDHEEAVSELGPDIARVNDDLETLSQRLAQLSERQTRLDDSVDSIGDDMQRLDGLADRLTEIQDEIESIRQHIESLDQFRNRITGAMQSE